MPRALIAIAVLLSGCHGPGAAIYEREDARPPELAQSEPASGATDVARARTKLDAAGKPMPGSKILALTFDEPLDPATLEGAISLVQATGDEANPCAQGQPLELCLFRPKDRDVAPGASYTVTFIHGHPVDRVPDYCDEVPLVPLTRHVVCVNTTLKDTFGNPLAEELAIPFTTAK